MLSRVPLDCMSSPILSVENHEYSTAANFIILYRFKNYFSSHGESKIPGRGKIRSDSYI